MAQFEFNNLGLGIQETSFTCDGLVMGGYYADPEQDCQAYHVCLQVIFIGNLGKISRRAFSPGRRPKPLPSLLPLSKWNSFQPGDLCLRLVVSEQIKSPHLTLSAKGSMWTVKQLPASTVQLKVRSEAPEVIPTPMLESALLLLMEVIVLAQSATAGALDRGIQVGGGFLLNEYAGWLWRWHSMINR